MKTCVIDIETSGLVPKGATYEKDFDKFPYILSMGWKINDEPVKEFIINQEGRKIPPEVTKINNITQEMVDASPHKLFDVLSGFILDAQGSDYIIGHNVFFDTSIIKANSIRMMIGTDNPMYLFNSISDLLHKDKRIDTMRAGIGLCGKWPKLSELYKKLFREEFEGHSAGDDVEACYKCYVEMDKLGLIKYPVAKTVMADDI